MNSTDSKPCTVCNEQSRLILARQEGNLYRCGHCDHCFTSLETMSVQEKYEAEYFDNKHSAWFNNPNTKLFDYILKQIRQVKSNASVLDVGAGRGVMLKYFREKAPELSLTGIDIAPIPPAEGITFIQGDALEMKFDLQFDIVISLDVIEHVHDIHKFVKGLSKLCAPGGIVIVSTVNDRSVLYAVARLMRHIGLSAPFNRVYDNHHLNHFNVSSLRQLLEANQLLEKETHHHNVPLAAVDIVAATPFHDAVYRMGVWGTFVIGALLKKTYHQTVVYTNKKQ